MKNLILILFLFACKTEFSSSPCDTENDNFFRNLFAFSVLNNQNYCNISLFRRNQGAGNSSSGNKITGTISGLTRQNLTVSSGTNPSQTLMIQANSSSFEFPDSLSIGTSYNLSITNNSQGNVCTVTNAQGTIPATGLSISCRPIYNLYVMITSNGNILNFEADETGNLTQKATIASGISTPSLFLWNKKHIIIAHGTSFRTYLRNPDGSLTLAQTYTSTYGAEGFNGTPSVHPNGRFLYYKVGGDNMNKTEIDTNGILGNEVVYSRGSWLVPGPIHPTGNYIINFNKSSPAQWFRTVNSSNGTLSLDTENSPSSLSSPTLYPERNNCVYSLNGNFLYCGTNENFNTVHSIRQMSITSTSMAFLTPNTVNTDSFGSAAQGPKWLDIHPNGNYLFVYGRINIFSYSVNTVTGIINPTPITTILAPSSCAQNTDFTMIALNQNASRLYTVCNPNGNLGSYPVSPTAVISAPTIFSTGATNTNFKLLFVNGE